MIPRITVQSHLGNTYYIRARLHSPILSVSKSRAHCHSHQLPGISANVVSANAISAKVNPPNGILPYVTSPNGSTKSLWFQPPHSAEWQSAKRQSANWHLAKWLSAKRLSANRQDTLSSGFAGWLQTNQSPKGTYWPLPTNHEWLNDSNQSHLLWIPRFVTLGFRTPKHRFALGIIQFEYC